MSLMGTKSNPYIINETNIKPVFDRLQRAAIEAKYKLISRRMPMVDAHKDSLKKVKQTRPLKRKKLPTLIAIICYKIRTGEIDW